MVWLQNPELLTTHSIAYVQQLGVLLGVTPSRGMRGYIIPGVGESGITVLQGGRLCASAEGVCSQDPT